MTTNSAYELGFQSVDREYSDRPLDVEGTIPSWLSGALVRNGPGRFEVSGERVNHWFDGLAMLRRYAFSDGDVRYTNRFLRTEAYRTAETGDGAGEFATGNGALETLGRWLRALGPPEPTDNANVQVVRFGDEYVALTETPRRVAFDPTTLETESEFAFDDNVTEHLAGAHHVVDDHRGETVGHALQFGRPHRFHLYRVPHGSNRREHVATIPAKGPGYVHSFALTADHAVLIEPPLQIDVLGALSPWTEGLLDLLEYRPENGTRIAIVDRESGELVAEPTVEPFFVFHHVNAFEADDEVVMDLVEYEDADIVDALGFDALLGADEDPDVVSRLVRYRVDPETGATSSHRRYDGGIELPTVPRDVRTRPYRFAYGQATGREGANGLVKVDLERGTATEWFESNVYVEEPRVVRRPDADAEDDGVVIATALDVDRERSVLLVFDAATLEERARAPLPHVVPFGFHGRFFPEAVA